MDISSYFKQAVEQKATDIHLVAGSVPALRIMGELMKLNSTPLDAADLEESIYAWAGPGIKDKLISQYELDFSRELFDCRFRVNLHFQEGKIGLAARLIPSDVPRPEELGFTETIYGLTHLKDGLILVTGPSGCGKSTTLAAMINLNNHERRANIITIEDPIEYMFKEDLSIIEQRELGQDTKSFDRALKYALRQDPNVIMVGEMRDMETISAALTAAETGHLVMSTLHTITAAETISRIVDVYPAHQQAQIFNQLASTLRAIIAQQLLPKKDGGRVAAREILINNSAITTLIKRNQISQIQSVIQSSFKEGMIPMNKSIDSLLSRGIISEETAKHSKRNWETQAEYY